jgi:hypothetical protein
VPAALGDGLAPVAFMALVAAVLVALVVDEIRGGMAAPTRRLARPAH